jgi:hypothetical protein
MKGHSYVIDLPPHMRMSNVFHADRLRKAAENLLPGQYQEPEPPTEINGEPEYDVEEVLASRVHNGGLQYQVQWTGHDPDDQWYNAEGFIGAPQKIKDYHDVYPEKPGPPARLQLWMDAHARDEDLQPITEDNLTYR